MIRTRWLIGAAFAVPLAAVAAVYFYHPDGDIIDDSIRSIGFYPLMPPSTLRAPGSIYYVSPDGRYYSMLCEVDPARLSNVMRVSPTTKQVSTELKKAKVGFGASVLTNVSSSEDASLLQSVKLELDDVEVGEISLETLGAIADELLQRDSCSRQVERYLQAGDYVCQGQQVLKATTNYAVEYDNLAKASASRAAPELDKAAEVIKVNVDADAHVVGSKIRSGKGLYFGIKLAPRCMYLPNGRALRPPLSLWQRVMNRVGFV